MKKSIKQIPKTQSSTTNKKNTRQFEAKKAGYKEDVYNSEEQSVYNKSELNKNKENTAGPKS